MYVIVTRPEARIGTNKEMRTATCGNTNVHIACTHDHKGNSNMDMRRLTTGIRSEKCVVRQFRRCANVIQCTYTNPDSTV